MINLNDVIIVSKREYFPLLFKFKNSHPDCSIKIISRDDLIDKLSFQYVKDPVKEFIKDGLTYNKAKKLSYLLRVADCSKNEKLTHYFSLIKDSVAYDDYGEYELKQKPIYLFEMQEDIEIKSLIKRHILGYFDISIDDLDIEYSPSFKDIKDKIFYFENKFEQFSYIFSDIRKQLVEEPNLQTKIKILIKDETDIFYIKLCSNLFGIECCYTQNRPLLSNPKISLKLDELHKNKSLTFAFDSEEKELITLNELIESYGLRSFNFDFAYPNLLEILFGTCEKISSGNKGISIVTDYTFDTNSRVYISIFQDECFYKVFDDNNVLTDSELAELSLNTSYYKTLLDKRLKLNFLKTTNAVFYSRVTQHLNDNIYDSQFVEELKLGNHIQNKTINENGLFTDEARKIINKSEADRQYCDSFLEKDEIPYSHDYKKISNPKDYVKSSYSVTNLEKYLGCPFAYLINSVIQLKDFDPHFMARGILIHRVCEDINHNGFDFEKSFQEGVKEYKQKFKECGKTIDKKYEVYIDVIHHWLKIIIDIIFENYKSSSIVENKHDYEKSIEFNLNTKDSTTYLFKGKIDKIVWTQKDDKKYYTIIDYKSGDERYLPRTNFLGQSIQLPLYYYAIKERKLNAEEYTGDGEFGGFGIQPVYARTISKLTNNGVLSKESISNYLRLDGVINRNTSYLSSIDPSTLDEKGKIQSGKLISLKYSFSDPKSETENILEGDKSQSRFNLEDLINDAIEGALRTINAINSGDFPIAPTSREIEKKTDTNHLVCSNCQFGDICYRDIFKDVVSYKEEIDARFKKGE